MKKNYTISRQDGSVIEFNHDSIQEYSYSSNNNKHQARVVYKGEVYNFKGEEAKSLIDQLQLQVY